jgi:MFS family permease
MALTAAALALFAAFAVSSSTPLAFALLLLGTGFALFSSPNTNAVMSQAEPERLGSASALLATMRLLGQTASLLLAAFLLPRGGHQPQALLASLRQAFALSAALCLLGIPLSLARGSLHRKASPSMR